MNAHERLNAAKISARKGQFEEALNEYIWFHKYALEEEPALRGVRLSFALGYWMELAGQYPPARMALQSIRDEKTRLLKDGAEDWDLFNDVSAINETLSNDEATYDLFCLINRRNTVFATQCARCATPALVKAYDFNLARSFISDPEKAIEELASRFNNDIEQIDRSSTPERVANITNAEVRIYAEDVEMLIRIIGGAGEWERADALAEHAITLVGSSDMQDAVRAALSCSH
jgi:hypothetical protein